MNSQLRTWMDAPRTMVWSVTAWLLATAAFVSLTIALGGPASADSAQSVYTALMMSHGRWSCAYPPLASSQFNGSPLVFISPFYTLLSAGFARLMGLGSGSPFPSIAGLGANCSHAITQTALWTQSTNALTPMLRFGFISWVVLSGGVVTALRACHKGRNGREAMTLMAVACSAPVVSSLVFSFHPEDIMAMGLILFAIVSLVRERWLLVGVFVALAALTQLYALLALIPLAVSLPRTRRVAFATGFVATLTAVALPLAMATSGRVFHSMALGTSKAGESTISAGGTVLFSTGLHGTALFLLSRVAPLLAAAALSFGVVRRWGDDVRQPEILVSLVATSLALRLVFEVNAFGYYYMASIVALLVLDALRGRIRGGTFALIGLITLVFNPVAIYFRWRGQLAGPEVRAVLPLIVSIPVVTVLLVGFIHRHIKWYLVIWQSLVLLAFVRVPLPVNHFKAVVPLWCWQLLLVPPLLFLLTTPLRESEATLE